MVYIKNENKIKHLYIFSAIFKNIIVNLFNTLYNINTKIASIRASLHIYFVNSNQSTSRRGTKIFFIIMYISV
jgi:hypothetical protein